jgi:hypothetical protein
MTGKGLGAWLDATSALGNSQLLTARGPPKTLVHLKFQALTAHNTPGCKGDAKVTVVCTIERTKMRASARVARGVIPSSVI